MIGAVSLAVLYYGALISLPNIIDLNKYKDTVAAQIEEQSGFKISCENIEFKRSFTPYLKVHMYHTLVLYPNNEIFLKLKDSELKVKILPLLFKKIVIKDVKLTRPVINVTLYDDFSTSIEKYIDASKNIKSNGFILNSIIKDTVFERYKLKINDETIGKTFYLEGDRLLLKDIKLNESAHIILQGALYESEKEYLKYDMDVVVPLNSKTHRFTFSPFKTILESDIKGFIEGKFQTDKNNNINGFLKVSNLSVKADDIVLADNSINLLFKGQEAVIEASVHTSEKDSAIINGKFNYGKRKYIDLAAKARNVDLANIYKIVSVLSESLNIPNKIKDLKVSGLLDADFSLNSDFKKLKSNGNARVIDAQFVHSSLPYRADRVNANINLDNNKITIEKAQAYVNSTPISLTGTINEDVSVSLNVFSDNLDLKKSVKIFNKEKNIPFDLLGGKLSFKAEITGNPNKSLKTAAKAEIKDFSAVENKYKIPVNVKLLDINMTSTQDSYNGEILCNGVKTDYDGKELTSENLKFVFDNKKIIIPDNTFKLLDSPVKIKGSITNYLKNPDINIDFSGNISAENAASIIKKYIKEQYKAKGYIKTNGVLKISEDKAKLQMKINADENNYLSYLVIKELLNKKSVLNIDADFHDNILNLKDISLYEDKEAPKKILSLIGQIDTGNEIKLKSVKFNVPESLTASTNFFGGEEFSLKCDLEINYSIKNPLITGDAKLHFYNLKKYLTAVKNADVSFRKDNIRIIAPDVQINNSKLNVIADVQTDFKDNIIVNNMQLNSFNLDLNSVNSIIENERNPFANSLITIKKGVATVNKLQVLDLKARDISSDFSLEKNILKLENISAHSYNGLINGKINYDIPYSRMDLMLEGKNINMKDSLYDLCKIEDNISGTADFKTSVSFTTGDYTTALKSLNGNIDFSSVNGRMGTLGKFEYYLYAQNILYHGILNATLNRIADAITKDNTAHYRFADGKMIFQNGYMITSSVKTTGQDMSLYVTGRHNLLTNQVNIDIYGRISDEIKNKLGSFGDVSISDFIDNPNTKTSKNVMLVSSGIIDRIPELYNQGLGRTNIFKVNIYGDINSLNSINSFMWLLPKEDVIKQQQEKLPDFSDIMKDEL